MWVVLIVTILAVGWGWKNSRYLLPLLILSLPLEVSRTWFPNLSILNNLGKFVGVIYFGRILTLAVIAYFIYKLLSSKRTDVSLENARGHLAEAFRSPLFMVLGCYIIWGAISVIWSVDRQTTLVAVARLSLLWVMGAAVYYLVKRRDGLITVPLSFAVVSTFLAGIGLYELLTQHYLWFAEIFQPLNRVNATFVDANIYARFLNIGCLATAMLMLNTNKVGKLIGVSALALQLVALLGTGSRMGWLTLILVALVLATLIPRRIVILPILGVLAISGITVLLNHKLLTRILEIKQNFWAASAERDYLMTSGLHMFTQNPLQGVGLGGFQHVMLTTYVTIIRNGVSLSHTALITSAAELGIIGFGLTVVLFIALYGPVLRQRQILFASSQPLVDRTRYYWQIFAVVAITAIFVSAQAEGRFFEDPYLWVLIGYLAAIRNAEQVTL